MKRTILAAALAISLSGCLSYPVSLTDSPPVANAEARPSLLGQILEALLTEPDTTTTTYWVNGTPTRVSVYQSPDGRRSSVRVH